MSASPYTHNYISHIATSTSISLFYHNRIIMFGPQEFSQCVFPGLLHELKTHSRNSDFFHGVISSPSRYQLPPFIDPDTLIENIRHTLASAFLFIHTWILENSSVDTSSILQGTFTSYEMFFDHAFTLITKFEYDKNIQTLSNGLQRSLKQIYSYLGAFQNNFKDHVHFVQDVVTVIVMLIYVAYIWKIKNRLMSLPLD